MVSRWFNIKQNIKKKRYSLRSLGVGIIFFIFLYVLTKAFNTSLCIINRIFKIKCFGCGMTRAFISILHLDFVSAFKYNVLSIPLFFAIALYCFILVVDILFSKNFVEVFEKQLSKKYMYIFYIVILMFSALINNVL